MFNAINPKAIVNGMIRSHCYGLDFSTASPHKYFAIVGNDKGKTKYCLYDENHSASISKSIESSLKEKLPEEKMADDYNEHIKAVKMQLMNAILNASPRFFEVLVLELLMKIGYGYDEDSGKVTRYCKDGGIDGIIEEDKLGLDKIYIQAKRYNIDNKVSSADVDAFATSMGKKGVKKGVFITTSHFSKTALIDYSEPVDGKTIRLISGDELMDLLIKYEIGVNSVKSYRTFSLDENYFNS